MAQNFTVGVAGRLSKVDLKFTEIPGVGGSGRSAAIDILPTSAGVPFFGGFYPKHSEAR